MHENDITSCDDTALNVTYTTITGHGVILKYIYFLRNTTLHLILHSPTLTLNDLVLAGINPPESVYGQGSETESVRVRWNVIVLKSS